MVSKGIDFCTSEVMQYKAEDSDDSNIGKRFLDYSIDRENTREENLSSICEGINLAEATFITSFFFLCLWTSL